MKITRQHSQLILEREIKRSSSIKEVLFGLPFLLFGCYFFVMSTVNTQLTCQRLEPTIVSCDIDSSSVILGDETTHIRQLTGAELDVNYDSEDGNTYRVMLHTDAGNIPLTKGYDKSRLQRQNDSDTIARFITNDGIENPTHLKIEQKGSLIQSFFGGLFALIGASVLFFGIFSKVPTTLRFDKGSQHLAIEYKNLIGKSHTEEYPLIDVESSYVKEDKDGDGDTTYDVIIELKRDEPISLGSFNNNDEIASSINNFLLKVKQSRF